LTTLLSAIALDKNIANPRVENSPALNKKVALVLPVRAEFDVIGENKYFTPFEFGIF
jgi:tagatose-1,6-bisphosphate aldolase